MTLTPEQEKLRRKRNMALAWTLAAFAALFFAVTIAHLGGNVMERVQ